MWLVHDLPVGRRYLGVFSCSVGRRVGRRIIFFPFFFSIMTIENTNISEMSEKVDKIKVDEKSKDYYFDSYAHFGIITVSKKSLIKSRHPRGNAQRHRQNHLLPQLHLPKLPSLQKQGCSRCRVRYRYSMHVCCQIRG